MGLEIVSGERERYKLIIDRFNRARVFSTSTSQEHHASTIEEAYMASTIQGGNRTLTVPTAFAGPIMSIKNTNVQRRMSFEKLLASASAAGLVYYFTRNPIEGTLANNTLITPVNLNYGSAKNAAAEVNVWDEAGTAGITGFTSGVEFDALTLNAGPYISPLNGSFLVEASNIFLFNVENTTGGPIEFSFNARFFYEGVDA